MSNGQSITQQLEFVTFEFCRFYGLQRTFASQSLVFSFAKRRTRSGHSLSVDAAFIGCIRSSGQGTGVRPFRVWGSPLCTKLAASLLASLSMFMVASGRRLNFLSLNAVSTDLRTINKLCQSQQASFRKYFSRSSPTGLSCKNLTVRVQVDSQSQNPTLWTPDRMSLVASRIVSHTCGGDDGRTVWA